MATIRLRARKPEDNANDKSNPDKEQTIATNDPMDTTSDHFVNNDDSVSNTATPPPPSTDTAAVPVTASPPDTPIPTVVTSSVTDSASQDACSAVTGGEGVVAPRCLVSGDGGVLPSSSSSSSAPSTNVTTKQEPVLLTAEEMRRLRLARFNAMTDIKGVPSPSKPNNNAATGGSSSSVAQQGGPSIPTSTATPASTDSGTPVCESVIGTSNIGGPAAVVEGSVAAALSPPASLSSSPPPSSQSPSKPMEITKRRIDDTSTLSVTPTKSPPSFTTTTTTTTPPPHTPIAYSTITTTTSASSASGIPGSPSQENQTMPHVWENNVIKQIFQVTLKPEEKGIKGNLIYLKKFANELIQDGKSLDYFTSSTIDRIIISVCGIPDLPSSSPQFSSLLDYFIKSYKTAHNERQKFPSKSNSASITTERINMLEETMNLIVSYTGLLLQFPSMFPRTRAVDYYKQFELMVESESELPVDFLQRMTDRLKPDSIQEIFHPIIDEVCVRLLKTRLGASIPQMRAFAQLIKHKAISNFVLNSPKWVSNKRGGTGKEIEVDSYLGPMFRISSLPSNSSDLNPLFTVMPTPQNERDNLQHIRTELNIVQVRCHDIVRLLLQKTETRKIVLEWTTAVINRNRNRIKMNADLSTMSTVGFMLNFVIVLLKLCKPFVENLSKISSIDPDYIVKSSKILISEEETRLALDTQQFKSYYKEISEGGGAGGGGGPTQERAEPNFITECFFSTIQAIHLVTPHFSNFDRNMRAPTIELTRKVCLKAQLLDPEFLSSFVQFYNFLAAWLVRIATGKNQNRPSVLPLPGPPPKSFAALPEYVVENLAEFLTFYFTHIPRQDLVVVDEVINFLVTFTSSTEYIKNPYLRGKFIEALSYITPKYIKGALRFDPFENDLAKIYLGSALIKFYIDVEITGASTQFYDKFNSRFFVSLVMRHVWGLKSYSESFSKAMQDQSLFLRFTNMLINDSIFLLDESFGKLTKIRTNEELFVSHEWSIMPPQRQNEIEQEHANIERMVRTYLLLGRETTRMLHYITSDMAKLFMIPELKDRIAAMLNYFLVQLAGPKYHELRVKNPEKYGFKPRKLLKMIATTYLNFVRFDEFPVAVARDGRSYNPAIFEEASNLLLKTATITIDTYNKFNHFLKRAKEEADAIAKGEQDLGDIPEQFLDPIMQTLMMDPVILPSSRLTVDRVTITRHLLSTPSDPFNRAPLTIEQLQPDLKLKAEIDAWLSSKKKKFN